MPGANIIQLRQLLSEKFPGARPRMGGPVRNCWPTGLPQIDGPLDGGLPRGALAEVIAENAGSGGALLMAALIHQAARERQIIAVVDGRDSLEVTQIGGDVSRLLWVRCRSADEAMKAADLLLRDRNMSLVVLDLAANPAAQLRKIPATVWYRFQRLLEQTSTVCAVLTPRAMVSPAKVRITLRSRFSLAALEAERDGLLRELRVYVSAERRSGELFSALKQSA